jgi:hypothetical protein
VIEEDREDRYNIADDSDRLKTMMHLMSFSEKSTERFKASSN